MKEIYYNLELFTSIFHLRGERIMNIYALLARESDQEFRVVFRLPDLKEKYLEGFGELLSEDEILGSLKTISDLGLGNFATRGEEFVCSLPSLGYLTNQNSKKLFRYLIHPQINDFDRKVIRHLARICVTDNVLFFNKNTAFLNLIRMSSVLEGPSSTGYPDKLRDSLLKLQQMKLVKITDLSNGTVEKLKQHFLAKEVTVLSCLLKIDEAIAGYRKVKPNSMLEQKQYQNFLDDYNKNVAVSLSPAIFVTGEDVHRISELLDSRVLSMIKAHSTLYRYFLGSKLSSPVIYNINIIYSLFNKDNINNTSTCTYINNKINISTSLFNKLNTNLLVFNRKQNFSSNNPPSSPLPYRQKENFEPKCGAPRPQGALEFEAKIQNDAATLEDKPEKKIPYRNTYKINADKRRAILDKLTHDPEASEQYGIKVYRRRNELVFVRGTRVAKLPELNSFAVKAATYYLEKLYHLEGKKRPRKDKIFDSASSLQQLIDQGYSNEDLKLVIRYILKVNDSDRYFYNDMKKWARRQGGVLRFKILLERANKVKGFHADYSLDEIKHLAPAESEFTKKIIEIFALNGRNLSEAEANTIELIETKIDRFNAIKSLLGDEALALKIFSELN
jgi:hypothetical protein